MSYIVSKFLLEKKCTYKNWNRSVKEFIITKLYYFTYNFLHNCIISSILAHCLVIRTCYIIVISTLQWLLKPENNNHEVVFISSGVEKRLKTYLVWCMLYVLNIDSTIKLSNRFFSQPTHHAKTPAPSSILNMRRWSGANSILCQCGSCLKFQPESK